MLSELRDILEAATQFEELGVRSVLLSLIVSALCGTIVYLTYRFFYRGAVYSESFGILILLVSVVTGFIIITIGANLILSLGMVGALSIVRFRAAVKDPLDVGFLYWAVAAGLTAGARLYLVAVLGSVFVALLYMLITLTRGRRCSYLLILRYESSVGDTVDEMLDEMNYRLKNKTLAADSVELTAEIKLRRNNTGFLNSFNELSGVSSAVLVEYTGEFS